ncbi:MAG: tetratricopeptide repeat protein [Bacteroidales bacterium]|nr:tetratricopeptide repeat protein [Bacteroidales bacterium]
MIFRKSAYMMLLMLIWWPAHAQSENTDYQYALIEAVKQKNLGNVPGAIELYKMVLEENSNVAVAHYELGTLFALMGNREKAAHHLETAVTMDPGNKWYFESYVDVLLMIQDFKSAQHMLKARIGTDKGNVDHLYKLANVYFLDNKSRKAIKTLEKIEREHGLSEKITLLKANIYEKRGDYKKALSEVEAILDRFPESVQFHLVAAELAMNSNDEDLAARYYRKVFDLDSLNIYALTNLTDYYREKKEYKNSFFYLDKSFQSDEIDYDKKMAILSFYLSDEYFSRNHGKELEKLLVTMMNKYPDRRDVHLFASDFFIKNMKYREALDALLPLLNKKQEKYPLWRQGILLANATGRMEDLLKITSMAVEMYPDSAEMIFYKGIAAYENEKYEEVILTFSDEQLARVDDQDLNGQARMLLAESYNQLEMYDVSDSIFREIIRSDPDNYLVMNNFSYYLSLREESLDEAERLSRITIEKEPQNGTYLDTYAWILYKRGEYEEAETYIMQALKWGGEGDLEVNLHAAEIYKSLGNIPMARAFYQKALVLGGDKEELIRKLEALNGRME